MRRQAIPVLSAALLSMHVAGLVCAQVTNLAPTDISLDNPTIAENLPKGTEVGTLTAVDPNEGNTHTFKLQDGADKSRFKLSGNKLTTNAVFDRETKAEL
jgi:hypothetical protein